MKRSDARVSADSTEIPLASPKTCDNPSLLDSVPPRLYNSSVNFDIRDTLPNEAPKDSPEDSVPTIERNTSVWMAIVNLANATFGAGLLSLPYAFYCGGLGTSLISSLVVVLLCISSLHVLARACCVDGGIRTYTQVIDRFLGPIWCIFSEVSALVCVSGLCIVYLIAVPQFIKSVLVTYASGALGTSARFLLDQRVLVMLFACVFVYPLLLLRSMRSLAWTSLIANIATTYLGFFTVGACVAELVKYGIHLPGFREWRSPISSSVDSSQRDSWIWLVQIGLYGGFFPAVFLGLPLQANSYGSHVTMVPIAYEMKRSKSEKKTLCKLMWVIVVTQIICFVVYSFVSSSGLLLMMNKRARGDGPTPDISLTSMKGVGDNILNWFDGSSPLADVARVAVVNLMFSTPMMANVGRLAIITIGGSIRDLCRKQDSGDVPSSARKVELTTNRHIILTTTYFSVMLLTSLFVPGISLGFGFVGAVPSCAIMFFFPGIIALWHLGKMATTRCAALYWRIVGVVLLLSSIYILVTGILACVFELLADYNLV